MPIIEEVKHLQRVVDRKNKEIKDIKTECIAIFREINELCLSKYSDTYKLNKIRSVACDQYLILMQDLCIEEKKIIELPNSKLR